MGRSHPVRPLRLLPTVRSKALCPPHLASEHTWEKKKKKRRGCSPDRRNPLPRCPRPRSRRSPASPAAPPRPPPSSSTAAPRFSSQLEVEVVVRPPHLVVVPTPRLARCNSEQKSVHQITQPIIARRRHLRLATVVDLHHLISAKTKTQLKNIVETKSKNGSSKK